MSRKSVPQWYYEDHLDFDNPTAVLPDGTIVRTDYASLVALHGPEDLWRARMAARAYADELERLGVEPKGGRAATAPRVDVDVNRLRSLVSKEEAAEVLRCSERTVDRLVAAGKLRASRQSLTGSSRVLIDRASLLAHLDSIRT